MEPYITTTSGAIYNGPAKDVLSRFDDESAHCIVTSPPYWGLRDYGVDDQIGLEKTPEEYVANLVGVFREGWRVLRKDGTLWCNLGDSYTSGGRKGRDPGQSKIHPAYDGESYVDGLRPDTPPGLKPKDLVGIPWMVAFALRADGWYLRSDIIWHKPNPMPESVTDRPTKSHEYLFLMSKSERYFYDHDAIKEPHGYNRWTGTRTQDASVLAACYDGQAGGTSVLRCGAINPFPDGGKNKRSVWTVTTKPFPEAHFATFPPALIEPCILAGCPVGGTVLDPFFGSGTTGLVAHRLDRRWAGVELNPEYCEMAAKRIGREARQMKLFAAVS